MLDLSVAGFHYWSAACCDPLWSLATGYWSLLPLLHVWGVPMLCFVLEVLSISFSWMQTQYDFMPSPDNAIHFEHGESHLPWRYGRHLVQEPSVPTLCNILSSQLFVSFIARRVLPPCYRLMPGASIVWDGCQQKSPEFPLLKLAYILLPGRVWVWNKLPPDDRVWAPSSQACRGESSGPDAPSVPLARYICILAVLFIWLFIWPKPWCLGNSLKGLRSIRIAWKEVVACSQRRREEFFPSL